MPEAQWSLRQHRSALTDRSLHITLDPWGGRGVPWVGDPGGRGSCRTARWGFLGLLSRPCWGVGLLACRLGTSLRAAGPEPLASLPLRKGSPYCPHRVWDTPAPPLSAGPPCPTDLLALGAPVTDQVWAVPTGRATLQCGPRGIFAHVAAPTPASTQGSLPHRPASAAQPSLASSTTLSLHPLSPAAGDGAGSRGGPGASAGPDTPLPPQFPPWPLWAVESLGCHVRAPRSVSSCRCPRASMSLPRPLPVPGPVLQPLCHPGRGRERPGG